MFAHYIANMLQNCKRVHTYDNPKHNNKIIAKCAAKCHNFKHDCHKGTKFRGEDPNTFQADNPENKSKNPKSKTQNPKYSKAKRKTCKKCKP